MRVGSLFDGISCFTLGLVRAGMTPAWLVEIDADCRRVSAKHFPGVPQYADVRECGRKNLEPVDVVVGGFPCQGLSVAGKRAGLADDRSGLWWEFARILGEMRPRWVLIENVPGLLSSWSSPDDPPGEIPEGPGWECDETSDFALIVSTLVELRYGVAWRVCDAQYHGLAQRRERVFIVGCLDNWTSAPAVLFEPDCCEGHPAPRRQAGTDVAGPVGSGTPGAGWRDDLERAGAFVPETAFCLPAEGRGTGDGHGQGWNSNYIVSQEEEEEERIPRCRRCRRQGVGCACGYCSKCCDLLCKNAICPCNQASVYQDSGSSSWREGQPTLAGSDDNGSNQIVTHPLRSTGCDASEDGTGTPLVSVYSELGEGHQTYQESDIANGLRGSTGGGGQKANLVAAPMAVRRLLPVETLRLQGLPDSWLDLDPPLSDSKKYHAIGNGGAVPVLTWIGKRIMEVARKT